MQMAVEELLTCDLAIFLNGDENIKQKTDEVVSCIVKFYQNSSDFNGIPISRLIENCGLSCETLKQILLQLIEDGVIEVVCSNMCINPHIKRLPSPPIPKQIEAFSDVNGFPTGCLYPSRATLESHVDKDEIAGGKFTKELILGAAQLEYRVFDLSVLEFYRNDPRYLYQVNGIEGSISVRDEYFETGEMNERDEVLLQTFGFAYDPEGNVAVAVYLRYLHDLSEEHQVIWSVKQLEGDYRLHPDYYRSTICGDWGKKISIFDAFLSEMHIINEMSQIMGRPPFFSKTFCDNPPKEFGYLIRPTAKEYNAFLLLLDNLLSSNINKKFFRGDLPLESEEIRADGKIAVTSRGTIHLLEEWLKEKVSVQEPDFINDIVFAFKDARKRRQKPAHNIQEDTFNQEFLKLQRDLMSSTYLGVRNLRLLFACHPLVRANPPKISKLLYDGEIWRL